MTIELLIFSTVLSKDKNQFQCSPHGLKDVYIDHNRRFHIDVFCTEYCRYDNDESQEISEITVWSCNNNDCKANSLFCRK